MSTLHLKCGVLGIGGSSNDWLLLGAVHLAALASLLVWGVYE